MQSSYRNGHNIAPAAMALNFLWMGVYNFNLNTIDSSPAWHADDGLLKPMIVQIDKRQTMSFWKYLVFNVYSRARLRNC